MTMSKSMKVWVVAGVVAFSTAAFAQQDGNTDTHSHDAKPSTTDQGMPGQHSQGMGKAMMGAGMPMVGVWINGASTMGGGMRGPQMMGAGKQGMPMMEGGKHGMQMMQERHTEMKAHREKMEASLKNIESLMMELVELQKKS